MKQLPIGTYVFPVSRTLVLSPVPNRVRLSTFLTDEFEFFDAIPITIPWIYSALDIRNIYDTCGRPEINWGIVLLPRDLYYLGFLLTATTLLTYCN